MYSVSCVDGSDDEILPNNMQKHKNQYYQVLKKWLNSLASKIIIIFLHLYILEKVKDLKDMMYQLFIQWRKKQFGSSIHLPWGYIVFCPLSWLFLFSLIWLEVLKFFQEKSSSIWKQEIRVGLGTQNWS